MQIAEFVKQIEHQEKEQDAIYRSVAAKYQLSDTAMWVLYMLSNRQGACTQQDLCRQSLFPKQTIHTTVSRLVKDEYLQLENMAGTRNQKQIIVTKRGEELIQTTVEKLKQAEALAYGRFTEEELENYLDMTQRISAFLREECEKL